MRVFPLGNLLDDLEREGVPSSRDPTGRAHTDVLALVVRGEELPALGRASIFTIHRSPAREDEAWRPNPFPTGPVRDLVGLRHDAEIKERFVQPAVKRHCEERRVFGKIIDQLKLDGQGFEPVRVIRVAEPREAVRHVPGPLAVLGGGRVAEGCEGGTER